MSQHQETAGERQMPHLLMSHVERCLQDIWEQHELHTDADGDWPYRWGTAACWVRLVIDEAQSCVRVFAHAAFGVKANAAVLRELNDLNARARWVRFVHYGDTVGVEGELHWTLVDRASLERVMRQVASAADDVGTLFATVHGGQTPFPPRDVAEAEDELAIGDDDGEAA
jgi:hypothetical protein